MKAGKTQAQLADYLEVTEAHISKVVNLKGTLSHVKLKMTAKFLGCTIDDLAEWDD